MPISIRPNPAPAGSFISPPVGLGCMGFVGEQVAVRQCSDRTWKLLGDLVYQGRRDTFTAPRDFETDFASVPQAFSWLVPRYGRYTRAAILHDCLCTEAAPSASPDMTPTESSDVPCAR